jgi:hypothetical protein
MPERLRAAKASRARIDTTTRKSRDTLPTVRIFIVVAKHRADLYQYFTSGFAGVDMIEVILDRRLGPDDHLGGAAMRRSGDRRIANDIYDELDERGFLIARVPA